MILAILSDPSKAETLLNNLSEADFDLKDVSVLMKDVKLRNQIARDAGPLKGILPETLSESLAKAGVSGQNVQHCTDAISRDKPVVAMKVDPKFESAAREMFQDVSAEILET